LRDFAQAKPDPDNLRQAAKIYEGMALIQESMGRKPQVSYSRVFQSDCI
jgi:hypothetical protein